MSCVRGYGINTNKFNFGTGVSLSPLVRGLLINFFDIKMPQKYTKLIQYYKDFVYIDGVRFMDIESARVHCAKLCNNGGRPNHFNFYRAGSISLGRIKEMNGLEEAVNAMLCGL